MELLTKYNLFIKAADFLEEIKVDLEQRDNLVRLFRNSAFLIKGLEEPLISDKEHLSKKLFWDIFDNRFKKMESDYDFTIAIGNDFINNEDLKKWKTYNKLLHELLRSIFNYQNKVIKNFPTELFLKQLNRDCNTIFLSYAYLDKGLSLALFIYFLKCGAFLFVDWMWSGKYATGSITKRKLEEVLSHSKQLLFLRTNASELHIQGNYSIRQWCAWEIGNFYSKQPDEKYYISFYSDLKPRKNVFLDSLKPMKELRDGIIE